jgi:glycosyltransferase involved in cell wall biosynthesis
MTVQACTIVSVSHLAQARVLAHSFQRAHPRGEVVVLVTDDPHGELVDDACEPFRVVRPEWLDLEPSEFVVMAGIYDAMELATSLKPWLMRRLLEESCQPLLYLDSDIEVFAPLDDLLDLSEQHGVAVTPHLLTPVPRDGLRPNGADMLVAGIYNAGFLGAGPRALSSGFFEFWCEQLARDAVLDIPDMLFADQRWLDFIDCFDHAVVRDATVNLAYWNAWARTLTLEHDRVLVDGRPLRFFHFSGFNPKEPHLLSRHQNRIELSDEPALAWLCRHWAAALLDAGQDDWELIPYGWARSGDLALDRTARRVYREAVLTADRTGRRRPPSPFGGDRGNDFLGWLMESCAPEGCTRYLRGYRDGRPDLCYAFPDPDGADARRLLDAAALDDGLRSNLAPQCVPRISHPSGPENRPLPGINIAGYFAGASGMAEAGPLVARAAAAAGLPFATRSLASPDDAPRPTMFPEGDATWPFDINVLCVNADSTIDTRQLLGPEAFRGRQTVAFWDWESPRLPSSMLGAWDWVDEVWVASRFTEAALSLDATKPVYLFPCPIPVRSDSPRLTRDDLGLPSGFLVLFCFDMRSVVECKNPAGLIAAYQLAFDPTDGAHLVFAVLNADFDRPELERLRLVTGRSDIMFLERALTPLEIRGLIAQADCYASLHRSEGFGLKLAEAMALGKPTVATAWSGNLDFMDEQTSLLVPADLTPIPASCQPRSGVGHWAEPDIVVAAEHLRWVFENPSGAAALGARARERIASTRTVERAGRFFRDAFERLHAPGPRR